MKRTRVFAITLVEPERNGHLVAILLWGTLFSVSASISLIAAAIYIH